MQRGKDQKVEGFAHAPTVFVAGKMVAYLKTLWCLLSMVLAELHSCSFFADLEGPFSVKFRVPGGVRVAAPAARGRPMRRLREGALMAASSPCIVPNCFFVHCRNRNHLWAC